MGMYIGLESEEYDRIFRDRDLLKRIFHYFSPYKRIMILVILFLAISSLSNSFVPILVRLALNNLSSNRNVYYLIYLLSIILVLHLLTWLFNYITVRYASQVIANVVLDLRGDAGQAVLTHDLSFFDRNPIGKIVSRINTDSRDFGQTVEITLNLISSLMVIGFLLIFMTLINLTLTLITIITFPAFFILALSFRKIARSKTLLGQRALASVNAYVKESFSGIQIAKTFRQEEKLYNDFNKVNITSYKVNLRRAFVLNG
ncbi:MAG: ABC transporter transmembrane domain-containing protein, partial [Promethearchaeota archaeon]